jgi:hypothetical protein
MTPLLIVLMIAVVVAVVSLDLGWNNVLSPLRKK